MTDDLVFLTGATGFIGSRLARQLTERGHRLRCFARPSSDTGPLHELGADVVTGELTDGGVLARAMHGARLAFHLAAIYDVGVVDASAMHRTNVEGTRAFLNAAGRARVARAVYVSTTVALGPAEDGMADPREAGRGPFRSAYEATKAEAHSLARAAQQRGLPLVIVCPAYVYGPGDEGPGGRFIRDLLRRRVPGLLRDPAWFSFVHVDDVVDGLLRAAEVGRIGECYVLGGEACSINDYAARVAAHAGRRAPRLRFPIRLARLTGSALDRIAGLTGLQFPISRENVDTVGRHRWVHPQASAVRDLGWAPRPLSAGLPPTVDWFQGQLRRSR
ncbi:MAG: NAD-dependent epimerase/dehydratase family protein [Longimicrobiales bacterium]